MWKKQADTHIQHANAFLYKQGQLSGKIHKRYGCGCRLSVEGWTYPSFGLFGFLCLHVSWGLHIKDRRQVKKNQGDGFLSAGYLLIPQYFPKPLMNLQAHPRGPPGELETAQLLCRPRASLVGPRGAKDWLGYWTMGRTKTPLCLLSCPSRAPGPASSVTAPEGFCSQPVKPQGKCSPGSPGRLGGGSPQCWSLVCPPISHVSLQGPVSSLLAGSGASQLTGILDTSWVTWASGSALPSFSFFIWKMGWKSRPPPLQLVGKIR